MEGGESFADSLTSNSFSGQQANNLKMGWDWKRILRFLFGAFRPVFRGEPLVLKECIMDIMDFSVDSLDFQGSRSGPINMTHILPCDF